MPAIFRAVFGAWALFACVIGATPASAQYWQCAPYARLISGIDIHGNAGTWWDQAAGKYARGEAPKIGAVLVLRPQGSMRVGHVATVSEIVSAREIKVTHANWSLIGGRRGQVEQNVRVVDVSDAGDWSRVRVWYAPLSDLGRTSYSTFGFIYSSGGKPAAPDLPQTQFAENRLAGVAAFVSALR